MIREIAARSGGTQIKILSDKSAERDLPEIVVSIAGSLKGKQEASAIILEQIELFKNGGPVLTTGSCLNDNIATQYKNSVQGQDSIISKQERRRPRMSSSESSRYSRRNRKSRSSSLEEKYISRRRDSDVNRVPESLGPHDHDEGETREPNYLRPLIPRDVIPDQSLIKKQLPVISNLPQNREESNIIIRPTTQNYVSETPPLPHNPKTPYEEEVRMKSILNLEIQK